MSTARTTVNPGARARRRLLAVVMVLGWLATLTGPAPAQTPTPDDDAVIESGNVRLGVNQEGHLNVECPVDSPTDNCPVGLQFIPTGNESTAPGCLCEGWGVGAADLNTSGYANESVDGVVNLELVDFFASASEAVSTVLVREGGGGDDDGGDPGPEGAAAVDNESATKRATSTRGTATGDPLLEVTHDFHPSGTPNLYEVTVSITNVGVVPVEDLRYRRVMDWDVEPTAFSEFVTIEGDAADLLFSSDNGFETANPLGSRSDLGAIGPPTGAPFADDGPADHGALFDFGFGELPVGDTRSFNIYYGAAATENEALLSIDFVGATLYSLGQPNTPTGPTNGDPNTFIFAFGSVGGEALERIAVRKRADHPESQPGDTNGYTVYLVNPTDSTKTVTEVVDLLPPGFTYVPGSSALDGTPIPDPAITTSGGSQELTWSGPFDVPATSTRLLTFQVTIAGDQAPGTYFNRASAAAVDAAGGPVEVRASGDAAPIRVPEPTVATDPAIGVGTSGSTTTDPDTGLVTVSMRRGARTDVTVTVDVECPDGSAPTSVTLSHGANTYPMTETPAGSGMYTATIPAADVVGGPIEVTAICDGDDITNVIGEIVLFDPSGIVTDASTGDPVVGAKVTLHKQPFALPDTDTETRDCRTVDTRGGTWDDLPDADPASGVEVDETIFPAEIDPLVNPQTTNGEGRYGWDVATGCYFIEVSAPGYVTQYSAVVGVPPEVTDLDIALEPEDTGGGGGGGGTPPSEECQGRAVTIFGTDGDDVIVGTNGPDVISGGGGNDDIDGLAGDDYICGNGGDDRLRGGGGNDRIAGNAGNDTIYGSAGDDFILAGTGDDSVFGSDGDDRLVGGDGNDFVKGGTGNDMLIGKGGDDDLRGGPGDDTLRGDAGNDRLGGGSGNDYLAGRGGDDRLNGGPDDGGVADRCYGNDGVDTAVNCETVDTVP